MTDERDVVAAAQRVFDATPASQDAHAAWAALIALTAPLPLTKLDTWERALREAHWKSGAERGSTAWKFWGRPNRFASWLDVCSGDGWQREAILRTALAGAPNRLFAAFALRRLNDWVPQVRRAAREHLLSIARKTDPEWIADALWAVLPHSASWGRMDESDRAVLPELLTIEAVARALRSCLLSSTTGPAALVLMQAGRSPAVDSWLTGIAATAVQPSVRARAVRCLLDGRVRWTAGRQWRWIDRTWGHGRFESVFEERTLTQTEPLEAVIALGLKDRAALVRRLCADAVIQHWEVLRPQMPLLAQRLAADANAAVAERGEFALAKLRDEAARPAAT